MWNADKNMTNNIKLTPPRIITHNNIIFTSIRDIINIAKQHFITKINKPNSPPNTTQHQLKFYKTLYQKPIINSYSLYELLKT